MLLAFAERLLNEQIRASTAARERLAALAGKRFVLRIRDTDLNVLVESRDGDLRLGPATDAGADVELTAGIFDLMRLARSSGLSALKSTEATLNGDLRLAESFAELFRLAVSEPEDLLAGWIGDMPAHALGETARAFGGWSRRAGRSLEQNLAEYLQEETTNLPPPPLARQFLADVDRIRDDVERAEKRLDSIERRLRPGAR